MKHARIQECLVVEIIELPDDARLADLFHPDILSTLVPAQDEARVGWRQGRDGLLPPLTSADLGQEASPISLLRPLQMRQLRLEVVSSRAVRDVQSYIKGLPSDDSERLAVEWEYATEVGPTTELAATVQQALKLTDVEFITFWTRAAAR